MDISFFNCVLFLKYISISFSIHLEAYVASFIFLCGQNVFTAFISPIVPIEIKSSTFAPVASNFFAIYTTSLKLCVISISLAVSSPSVILSITISSSVFFSGGGNVCEPFM